VADADLLDPQERAAIDAAMHDLVAAQSSEDPAEVERVSKALANATEAFAAARMNRGIAQALAGKNIANI
jgi:molecular chaperone HscA